MTLEQDVIKFIYQEARLLDDWQLDDWLALFADDGTYWLPMDEDIDPRLKSSVVFETRASLVLRVEQLMRHDRPSQSPRSQSIRQVTNIEVTEQDGGVSARYNLFMLELRPGDWRQEGMGQKRIYAGRCRLQLAKTASGWRIKEKRVVLLDRYQPIEGLSFIL